MEGLGDSFMQQLEQAQVFNFEIIIDRVRIIKGEQRNYIPVDEQDKVHKPPSFHGSVKKKKRKKRKKRKSSRKRKGKRRRSKRSRKGSHKRSKGSSSRSSSSSPKRSKSGSRKGSKTRSRSNSPKKGKKGKKGSKRKKSKSKRKKSKGKGKKGKRGDKTLKKKTSKKKTAEEKLPGNRKEVPPLRLGIDVLGFHDIYINQIDVDPVEEEEFISADGSPYTTAGTGTNESSEHGPVDPTELTKALEDVQKGGKKKKGKGRKSRGSSRGSKKGRKSRSRSRSRKSSKGSKSSSSKGSKKGSKRGSKKGSKRGSKKGSKRGSKKGSPKKKKKSKSGSKSPKGKKHKSGSKTPKSKADKTPATDVQADTWSVTSETTIKRGRALMLTEIPRRMITHFQGSPMKIRVERYGGKRHNNGEVIPVGSVTVPFPPDWSEAILEVQREMNPKTYDSSAFPIMRGLIGRYAIKDNNNEHIGDIKLEMNLYCYANSAVSKLFPTDATLYDALAESENIAKCCDRMVHKTRKGRKHLGGKMGPGAYYGWRPGVVPEYYAVQGRSNAREMQGDYVGPYGARGGMQSGLSPGGGETRRDYRKEPGVGAYEIQDEDGVGLSGDYFDIYPKAKKANYTEKFHL